ncbi:c-type cytochrome [Robiginitalea sp. SC105]|uniref:c-type cytochrome n=1 Tax=Robiginitalea sp. SC105 TaxID=2762332 RepID=UPI00163B0847|nr:c-type cytochrome [Robiginitalea sp. SC105]MBC2840566.1 c-type cytochrome [Robiginitalea sp. SC105]
MERIELLARRLFLIFSVSFALLAIAFIGMLGYKTQAPPAAVPVATQQLPVWHPRDFEAEVASAPSLVREGYLLVTRSAELMGPGNSDPAHRFSGNKLSCSNCHMLAGTRAGAASWVGVSGRFPQFGGRAGSTGTLEDRINGCMQRSMNGKEIPVNATEMQAMVAYMEWLGEGLPDEREPEFKGFPPLLVPDRPVDLHAGESLFKRECAVCHGVEGQGIKRHGQEGVGYIYPPLWGPDSYNDGAGMHRVLTAAAFIKGNMPFGLATPGQPKLSDAEAYDVAGYINSFERPHKIGLEADYPDKTLKPVSTPYGPWADPFPALQHKYGPFPPIIAYYKETYNLIKNK